MRRWCRWERDHRSIFRENSPTCRRASILACLTTAGEPTTFSGLVRTCAFASDFCADPLTSCFLIYAPLDHPLSRQRPPRLRCALKRQTECGQNAEMQPGRRAKFCVPPHLISGSGDCVCYEKRADIHEAYLYPGMRSNLLALSPSRLGGGLMLALPVMPVMR